MDLDSILTNLQELELPTVREICFLCDRVQALFLEEANVQYVHAPVTICGDIHGQFYDLIQLFQEGGTIPHSSYVFLGDFVDRGYHSTETILYLFALKARYPDKIVMCRGNHESRQITQAYGFYDECLKKFGDASVWRMVCECFDALTLSCVVDGKILGIHGGLSPSIQTLSQLQVLHRSRDVPSEGPMSDLLWSDPEEMVDTWGISPRGAGYIFGRIPVQQFSHINGLTLITRAHQLCMEGINYMFDNQIVTIWSAPNYCYRCGNKAAILSIDKDHNQNVKTFSESSQNATISPLSPPDYFL